MNSCSEDIKDMLEAQSSLGLVFGTNLFVAREPAEPDNCVTIYDTTGFPPAATLDGNVGLYYPSVQIQVRNRSYLTGYAIISEIVSLLHNRGPETWNGTVYMSILCVNDPGILIWEDTRVTLFTNFNIMRR